MRVVVAEDHALLADGLTRMLEAHGFVVAELVGNGHRLAPALVEHAPDVAVVDVRLPPSFTDEGIRGVIEARQQIPGLPVLVLSQYVEELYAEELMRDRAGAVGYLLKDRVSDVSHFVDALRQVAGGGTVMDPEVVTQLMGGQQTKLDELTPREQDVLRLMAEGRSNSAIASALYVTDKAVDKHSNNVFRKLGLAQSSDDNRRVLAVLAYLNDVT